MGGGRGTDDDDAFGAAVGHSFDKSQFGVINVTTWLLRAEHDVNVT